MVQDDYLYFKHHNRKSYWKDQIRIYVYRKDNNKVRQELRDLIFQKITEHQWENNKSFFLNSPYFSISYRNSKKKTDGIET